MKELTLTECRDLGHKVVVLMAESLMHGNDLGTFDGWCKTCLDSHKE